MFLCRRLAWADGWRCWPASDGPRCGRSSVVYGIWLFVKRPAMRWMIFAACAITVFFWFGVPTITNGKPDVAGQLALKSPRELHSNKIIGTIDRFKVLGCTRPVWIGAADRRGPGVSAAQPHRRWCWPGDGGGVGGDRDRFRPARLARRAALLVRAGGTGGGARPASAVGWLLLEPPGSTARDTALGRDPGGGDPGRGDDPAGDLAGSRTEHKDISHERARTDEINQLGATIAALGGREARPGLRPSGPERRVRQRHRLVRASEHRPDRLPAAVELHKQRPIVLFTSLPNGWGITP